MNWIHGVVRIAMDSADGGDPVGIRVTAGIADNTDARSDVVSAIAEVLGRAAVSAVPSVVSLRAHKRSTEACRASRPQSQTPGEESTQ